MSMLQNIMQKIGSKGTKKDGRKLAGLGLGIGAGGVGISFGAQYFQQDLIEFLPEEQRLIYILVTKSFEFLPVALEALGALIFIIGSIKATHGKEADGRTE